MRAKEFILEVSLENLAKTPIKGGMTLGQAITQKMANTDSAEFGQNDLRSMELVSAADPTNNNSMTKWLCKMYLSPDANFIIPEDINKIKNDLTKFMKLKQRNKLQPEHKNLDTFTSPGKLFQAMQSYEEGATDTPKEKAGKGLEFIIKEPGFNITHTTTYEANRSVGRNTNWCTAADSEEGQEYFRDYNSQGPLYQIIVGEGQNVMKYQFHYESDQFLDSSDDDVSNKDIALLSKYPGWAKFLNMMIEKHYAKYFQEA